MVRVRDWTAVVMLVCGSALGAQEKFPLAPPPGPQVYTHEMKADDEQGFRAIFDGESLKGWEGDPAYWRVVDHVLTGEITPQTLLKQNSFLIWLGRRA